MLWEQHKSFYVKIFTTAFAKVVDIYNLLFKIMLTVLNKYNKSCKVEI